MKILLLISTLIFMLQGCTSAADSAASKKLKERTSEGYLYYYIANSSSDGLVDKPGSDEDDVDTDSSGYGHLYTFVGKKSLILSEIVSKMADQLLFNYPLNSHSASIALTSLVDLNNHKRTNWLGQTISEQFVHELHIRKLKVVDYKMTGNIQVTENGEFAITRDWKKLKKNVDVSRILTGTMSRNEEGIIINIRIVTATDNMVEATSSAFIPNHIFVGGPYDYSNKYLSRDASNRKASHALVRLVE
jgi:TolB-like protein